MGSVRGRFYHIPRWLGGKFMTLYEYELFLTLYMTFKVMRSIGPKADDIYMVGYIIST